MVENVVKTAAVTKFVPKLAQVRTFHIEHILAMVLLILMKMYFQKEIVDHMRIRRINHCSQAVVNGESYEDREIDSQISAHDAFPTSRSMAVDS